MRSPNSETSRQFHSLLIKNKECIQFVVARSTVTLYIAWLQGDQHFEPFNSVNWHFSSNPSGHPDTDPHIIYCCM